MEARDRTREGVKEWKEAGVKNKDTKEIIPRLISTALFTSRLNSST
jgi:hypothetical protein